MKRRQHTWYAGTNEILQLIVAQAQGSSTAKEKEGRLRTVVLLQVLVMMLQQIGRVVWAGDIEALVEAMCAPREKEVVMWAATTLLGLLDTSDAAVSKRHMRQAGGCRFLEVFSKTLLQSANILAQGSSKQRQKSNTMLVLVCAAMAKQFALCTEYHWGMIDLAFLPALLGVARQPMSELELLRMPVESLVRLCTFLTAYRLAAAEENAMEMANPQMVQLLKLGAVDVITACVRQDDQGMSPWGIGFLHEFVSRILLDVEATTEQIEQLCERALSMRGTLFITVAQHTAVTNDEQTARFKNRHKVMKFEVGTAVLIRGKHMHKLAPGTYKLEDMTCEPLLRNYMTSQLIPLASAPDFDETHVEVLAITRHKNTRGGIRYLEPTSNFGSLDLIQEYWDKISDESRRE
ncbi:hypothetical protein BX661DRAFT_224657 [Kickxella alabastrina]|uniref:uncharacterized protein n=1 Tax=Kickxella alabastrina TaxID=61397 RepID=UPI00221EDC1F|nr:uncharacterized protein BX661DRAFT_224657 [Kickxella alabastrina]KAI7827932.1 hypothetical protein BX661DRAFT_224657 [Kickxella alabastrina]